MKSKIIGLAVFLFSAGPIFAQHKPAIPKTEAPCFFFTKTSVENSSETKENVFVHKDCLSIDVMELMASQEVPEDLRGEYFRFDAHLRETAVMGYNSLIEREYLKFATSGVDSLLKVPSTFAIFLEKGDFEAEVANRDPKFSRISVYVEQSLLADFDVFSKTRSQSFIELRQNADLEMYKGDSIKRVFPYEASQFYENEIGKNIKSLIEKIKNETCGKNGGNTLFFKEDRVKTEQEPCSGLLEE
ncbi:MAG: hypothetical protein HOO06_12185 [Bdellovibrionaceae bacterium]|nr:hypothetical protein [Pseudobdellovibrionaceae bacterium]